MTQKTKHWATQTPLKVYQPWQRKLKIEPHEPTKSLPTMTQKINEWATRTPLKVYQTWHRKLDWATRTPLKIYQPWHRKLKIEPHEPY